MSLLPSEKNLQQIFRRRRRRQTAASCSVEKKVVISIYKGSGCDSVDILVYLVFGKFFNLHTLSIFMLLGNFQLLQMIKYFTNNLDIWSYCHLKLKLLPQSFNVIVNNVATY